MSRPSCIPNPDEIWEHERMAAIVAAADHLAAMDHERRAKLETEWAAGEALNDRHAIGAELSAIVARMGAFSGAGQ